MTMMTAEKSFADLRQGDQAPADPPPCAGEPPAITETNTEVGATWNLALSEEMNGVAAGFLSAHSIQRLPALSDATRRFLFETIEQALCGCLIQTKLVPFDKPNSLDNVLAFIFRNVTFRLDKVSNFCDY